MGAEKPIRNLFVRIQSSSGEMIRGVMALWKNTIPNRASV